MRHLGRSTILIMTVWSALAVAQVSVGGPDLGPTGKGKGDAGNAVTVPKLARQNGISYHGGPVMLGPANVHYIWYGNWTGNTAPLVLDDFASNLGGSSYFNINTTYYDVNGARVSNSVVLQPDIFDAYSRGNRLSDADVEAIVAAQNPTDQNGVYFVLTSADVDETSGFCTQYCGWHNHGNINGLDIKYAFVGNPDRCPSACSAQPTGPNGNAGADAMASVVAHELGESVTDPQFNAWYDHRGLESADKCEWSFGQTYVTGNGSQANIRLGSRDYLIQQNWVNAAGGYCALSYGAAGTATTCSPGNSGPSGSDGTNPWPLGPGHDPVQGQPVSNGDGTNPWPLPPVIKK